VVLAEWHPSEVRLVARVERHPSVVRLVARVERHPSEGRLVARVERRPSEVVLVERQMHQQVERKRVDWMVMLVDQVGLAKDPRLVAPAAGLPLEERRVDQVANRQVL
jgi:hypothetical protein